MIMGVAVNKSKRRLKMVCELLELGSLFGLVHSSRWEIGWRMLLRLALDAVKGCVFLHGRNPPVVHCDVKSPNVLVSGDWHGKMGDFGLSNVAQHARKGKAAEVHVEDASPLWASPEALRAEPQSAKSDVFALATVVWECLTRLKPCVRGGAGRGWVPAGWLLSCLSLRVSRALLSTTSFEGARLATVTLRVAREGRRADDETFSKLRGVLKENGDVHGRPTSSARAGPRGSRFSLLGMRRKSSGAVAQSPEGRTLVIEGLLSLMRRAYVWGAGVECATALVCASERPAVSPVLLPLHPRAQLER